MATLAITYAINTNAGAQLRKVAQRLNEAASELPDNNPSGASVVLTFNDTPATGTLGWTLAGGSLPATRTYSV